MKSQTELHELNQQLIQQIKAAEQEEMAISQGEMHAQGLEAQNHCGCDNDSLMLAGLNTKGLLELEQKLAEKSQAEFNAMDARMSEDSAMPNIVAPLEVETGFLPDGAQLLTPSWSRAFSDKLENNDMALSNEIGTQAIVAGGNCKNVWNWAKGGGWGCTGGVEQNTQTVYWTFWFKPKVSRFYSIKPRFQFNGYYITKADDKWYNCKNTRLRISARTQAYQYNWKGLSSVDMVNINSGNINLNRPVVIKVILNI